MKLVVADFETFWSKDHNLRRLGPIKYCLSPLTQLISLSLRVDKEPTQVVFGELAIKQLLGTVDWDDAFVVGHNMSAFDALLMAWRLRIKPRMWGCTLAMARPLYSKVSSLSLAALCRLLGLPAKDNGILLQTQGKRLEDFSRDELEQMRVYNADDTNLCAMLFDRLVASYTPSELWHIDCNIRMLVEPEFELDRALLEQTLRDEQVRKRRALLELAPLIGLGSVAEGADESDLIEASRAAMASSAKFARVLESRGVDVPVKRSKTNVHKFIPAIAKTDAAMEELLDHDDAVVAAAAQARLATTSRQLETRIELFLDTHADVGKLPVPTNYCGADTTGRDSGWLYNMYNLPRILKQPRPSDALRKSVLAPPNTVIVAADSSGIELRVNHTLWQVQRSMRMWGDNPTADLYIGTAEDYYGVPPGTITASDDRRQLGKILELSCGFGIGAAKLRDQARAQYRLRLTEAEAQRGVDSWRARYPEIAGQEGGWQRCEAALTDIAEGRERAVDPWGLCHTAKDAIVLPSGRRIRYPNLRRERIKMTREIDGELVEQMRWVWLYDDLRSPVYLYGGKVDENIVQALARDVVFDSAIDFYNATGMRPKHKVYDELVYLSAPDTAADHLATLQGIMRTPPRWWPQLVVWSQGAIATNYGAAK